MSDSEVMEHEDRRTAVIEAAMEADGVPTTERRQQSYFGFAEVHRCMLPDGVSYVEHETLNEGARKQYQNKINREVAIKRSSGDAVMKMAAGDEKHELLKAAISGWNLLGADGQPMSFNKGTLNKFLDEASPKIIDEIEKDIRRHNPWLMADISVEEIDRQIEELEEMKQQKLREDEGKG